MAKNLATKILEHHLVGGELVPGREIAIRIGIPNAAPARHSGTP